MNDATAVKCCPERYLSILSAEPQTLQNALPGSQDKPA
jgi:hypothetical protein